MSVFQLKGTCDATIHNATNAKFCTESNICSGHGNCSHVKGRTCDCDAGWEGDDCSDSTNGQNGNSLSGGIIFLIVAFCGGAVIGAYFLLRNLTKKSNGTDDGGVNYPSATTSTLQIDAHQPLLNDIVDAKSYSTGKATTGDSADMLAKLLADSNSTSNNDAQNIVKEEGGIICLSCGKSEGIHADSNFCGLCGSKVR